MTAHINVLVDSRTFKYFFIFLNNCPNYSLHGLILMAIDHFTIYTVYKVFYCIISKLDNSYTPIIGESKRFKTVTP
jgi:hypothetical protein